MLARASDRPIFRETQDASIERIVIHGGHGALPPSVEKVLTEERERRKARQPRAPVLEIPPAQTITEVHGAIAATAKALRKAKPDKEKVVRALGQATCGILVSVTVVDRVITILDGLARQLEKRSLALEPTGTAMRVSVPPESVEISLVERIETRKHAPTVEELAAEERRVKRRDRDVRLGMWNYDIQPAYPEFDKVRTGALSLQIADKWVSGGLRRTWNDGKHQRLEGLLEDVVGGVVAYLAGVRARREEREAWEREWKRQCELRALAEARAKREEARRRFVRRHMRQSLELRNLRNLLEHWSAVAEIGQDFTRMMRWIEQRIGRLEHGLTPASVNAALREQMLFPEVDDLNIEESEPS